MVVNKNRKFVRLRQEFSVVVVALLLFFLCQSSGCWSLNEEGLALLGLREKVVNDPFGALSGWKKVDGKFDHCSWFGIQCSNGKVIVVNLKDFCLEGTLGPELGNLAHIKSINLRNNSFTGKIPEEIGQLKELEVLDLRCNNFSGLIPPQLGTSLSRTILLLDNNELLNQPSEAAKSSCKQRFNTWNLSQPEDAAQRRLLEEKRSTTPSKPQKLPHLFGPAVARHAPENPQSPIPSPQPGHEARPNVSTPSPSSKNKVRPNASILSPSPSKHKVQSNASTASTSRPRSSSHSQPAILAGAIGGTICLLILIAITYIFNTYKVSTVKPWRTGLSGQLQKAFVTGVPKLKRSELEAACEDFSNVIDSSTIGTVYKGTLSNGVEIAVVSFPVKSAKDWSKNLETQFRNKIETLSKVNHTNFVNLLGYCEETEPFTRMMVFEYAPNGTLFEHLHIKESEHLDWSMRLRIIMGIAYCLDHMHHLNPPIPHRNLSSSAINLTEDYAAKISDPSFTAEVPATLQSKVYAFGVLLFETITGRIPYTVDNDSIDDRSSHYLSKDQPLVKMVDPILKSFDTKQVESIGEVVNACVDPEPKRRPNMREVSARLREIIGISPDGAVPKLSPLWWAELEIMSNEF
ncbi:hypothetical protein ES332_A10G290400v1 [Gossypium tomentosum]|uniref:Protein kinase domain-containing protein n=1 Tax=Gossypium tomentosum TaxID=34277 RepID=A0A5D2NYZ1_GOSTO|nr:hypothetical protein ES332_A10G290400v1 [Gossypium tomentosum]TYI08316.1 hypothetical protein ES332_A10G290400v1 [Gossypium tomentosum]